MARVLRQTLPQKVLSFARLRAASVINGLADAKVTCESFAAGGRRTHEGATGRSPVQGALAEQDNELLDADLGPLEALYL
jgi:hypothetical protein